MKTKTITKTDFLEAAHAKQTILPAIRELKRIGNREISNNSYTAKVIGRAVSCLEAHIKDADRVFKKAADDFEAAGGNELLKRVAGRTLAIPGEITLRQRTAELLRQAHDYRVGELKHSGFSEKQIATIEPYPAEELAGHAEAVEALKIEQSKLNQFLESAPVYEMHHLAGTQFDGGLNQVEAA
ncbi:hypothetical protein U737_19040 [Methylomonas sp. LW13]|uniref:hypothetical protein n=1 Tax=unclassified Methylomonas TaxID=2608980 RepID=UPI00051B73D0|nr:hypothetical protein [Methylomonas sp. LW13]QBC28833.1 hypothetical protein U737_19040 [Methylomonas sp. LW13]